MTAAFAASVWAAYILNLQLAYCDSVSPTVSPTETTELAPSYKPFEFAFESNDGLGTTQHRRESSDADGAVTGAYGYLDAFGVYRTVEYVADANGFRAVIKTNEPGTAPQSTASAAWIVQAPPDIPQPPASSRMFPLVSTVQLRVNKANSTQESGSSVWRHRQIKLFPFPVLARSKGVVTIQLPVPHKSGKKKVKPVPRATKS